MRSSFAEESQFFSNIPYLCIAEANADFPEFNGNGDMKTKITLKFAAIAMAVMTGIASVSVNADAQVQQARKNRYLTIENRTYDFGKFPMSDGAKYCTFTYRNDTDTAIVIYNIKTSCKCTQAEWSKAPVKPGESGEIKVRYANEARPHTFCKDLQVYTSASAKPTMLLIKGTVTE